MYYKLIKTENKMLLNVNFKFLLCAKQSTVFGIENKSTYLLFIDRI